MAGEGDSPTVLLPLDTRTLRLGAVGGGRLSPAAPPALRLSRGLERMGEYKGSGFTEPKYLVRRGDGQVIQLSRLLYLVVSGIDGTRDAEAVSHFVSARYGAEVTADNVCYLVENKLTPLGVVVAADADSDEADGPRSDLLLALKGHRVIFGDRQVARIAAALAWLHRPLVVAVVLAATLAMDVWLFAIHGAMSPVLRVLEQPVWMLIVFFLTVASLVFHEFGHASACRYSGATPGKIGCGIFLIWPSMYTDVTDVYRIGRGGRLRTGLGGVYFNVIFMLVLTAAYTATGQPLFLAAVYLAHFEVLEQLMPAVRLDGYYILGDLAGVPDLYGKVKPILLSMVPGRPVHPEVADLKRSARVVVTVWVVTMIPLLVAEVGYVLWNLPRLLTTSLRSLADQLTGTYAAFGDGHFGAGAVGVIGSLMLVFPMAGGAYLAVRLGSRLVRSAVRATHGNTPLRLLIAAVAVAGAMVLAGAWWQGETPRPLPPAPPAAPALQPGVPTQRPTSSAAHTPRPGTPSAQDSSAPRGTTGPGPAAGATSSPSVHSPSAGFTGTPSASAGRDTTGPVKPAPKPSAGSPSPTATSAAPSASATDSVPPAASSPPASDADSTAPR
ncbi:hypothetical protein ACH4ZX_18895 [Streptomyces sp. NPDC020490]|uniref:hypothetical protein n=1 Tax=Streptomyces sp. NPDC020490 TaxID=3365078 RepID=UPI0037AE54DC